MIVNRVRNPLMHEVIQANSAPIAEISGRHDRFVRTGGSALTIATDQPRQRSRSRAVKVRDTDAP
jgi:hypothetical protein